MVQVSWISIESVWLMRKGLCKDLFVTRCWTGSDIGVVLILDSACRVGQSLGRSVALASTLTTPRRRRRRR